MHILYLEDNPLDADLARRAFARHAPGLTLEVAGTLAEARRRLALERYDVALIDVNLPDGDGMSLLADVEAQDPPTLAVILTGLDDEEAAVAALKAGADDYIVKRDDYLLRLPATLRDALARRQGRQDRRAQTLPLLAVGFEQAEREQIRRQLARYAPHVVVEFAPGHADLLGRLKAGGRAVEAVLLDGGGGLEGLNTLKLLGLERCQELPLLLVADQSSAELALQAMDLGAADYLVRHPGFLARLPAAIESCVSKARLARAVAGLRQAQDELEAAYDATLEGWARALELRDHETEGHSRRVAALSVRLAAAHGLPAREITHIRRGALLHDIGKMAVPDGILLKPGALTGDEWALMKLHPQLAHTMLAPIAFLGPALDIPYCHHERWDGAGYPRGLAGEQIPLAARIFAVADVWDALTSDRPYRRAMPLEAALAVIRDGAGTQFDPRVVALFFALELWRAGEGG
jgi:putative two-component system response regulator